MGGWAIPAQDGVNRVLGCKESAHEKNQWWAHILAGTPFRPRGDWKFSEEWAVQVLAAVALHRVQPRQAAEVEEEEAEAGQPRRMSP